MIPANNNNQAGHTFEASASLVGDALFVMTWVNLWPVPLKPVGYL
jgi:hypothetical protein